jgi:hypothetical protein
MNDEIAGVTEIFGIDRSGLIAKSISNFVESERSKYWIKWRMRRDTKRKK